MNPLMVVSPLSVLYVALGGAFGCTLRFLVIKLVTRLNPTLFPIGTMTVNIIGSLLIGMVLAKYGASSSARAFFVTGILGGFTTFSAFSWDAMRLLQKGQFGLAAVYIIGSVVLSIAAVMLGVYVVQKDVV